MSTMRRLIYKMYISIHKKQKYLWIILLFYLDRLHNNSYLLQNKESQLKTVNNIVDNLEGISILL